MQHDAVCHETMFHSTSNPRHSSGPSIPAQTKHGSHVVKKGDSSKAASENYVTPKTGVEGGGANAGRYFTTKHTLYFMKKRYVTGGGSKKNSRFCCPLHPSCDAEIAIFVLFPVLFEPPVPQTFCPPPTPLLTVT